MTLEIRAQEFERLHGIIKQEKGSLVVPKSQFLRAVRKENGEVDTLSARVRVALCRKLYADVVANEVKKFCKEKELDKRLAPISHTFPRKIEPLRVEIGSQIREGNVQVTWPRLSVDQDRPSECLSFPRKCEKWGLVDEDVTFLSYTVAKKAFKKAVKEKLESGGDAQALQTSLAK